MPLTGMRKQKKWEGWDCALPCTWCDTTAMKGVDADSVLSFFLFSATSVRVCVVGCCAAGQQRLDVGHLCTSENQQTKHEEEDD